MGRLLTSAAVVAVAVAVLPAPAGAAEPAPFDLLVPDVGVSTITGSYLPVVIASNGTPAPASLDGVRLTVDTTGAGFASVTLDGQDCSTGCDLGSLGGPDAWRVPQLFATAPGAAVGTSGSVQVTIEADGFDPVVTTAALTATDVNVVAGPATATYNVPNSTTKAQVVLQVTNLGSTTVTDLTWRLVGDTGLRWRPGGPDVNCGYGGPGVPSSAFYGPEQFCDVHNFNLEPGQTYELRDTGVLTPGATSGDQFAFEATFWAGDGAEQVTDVLRELPGMHYYSHGINVPQRIPEGTGAPAAPGTAVTGTITVD
ncbi:hypothetical protein JIG36_40990 [Actinoplanes sp. LDG1-06]|uniref:Uncharacterized protein n=1 Tax=Paractinoplanes ovalisporus TaxID=2810368 RepID=A0ABS2APX9_9ACTN|nr:hypothetical protein [Actinoplanes ovalisporus]MBM2621896.1 hypothetical protein [Actinoplanes ovalisporus]